MNSNRPTRLRKEVWMQVKDPAAVKRARKRAGHTQRDLAFLARCSQTTIYLIETGRMPTLSDDLAIRIARRLPSCDLEDLFAARESAPMPAPATGSRVKGRAA